MPHIDEKYYPEILGISANKALKIAEHLGPELTNILEKHLLGRFPNTYTLTKALAEELILSEAGTLPICIFRPAISNYKLKTNDLQYLIIIVTFIYFTVTPTYAEPTPGWVDKYAGAIGTSYAIAQGMMRVLHIHSNKRSLLVPVDFCANTVLACGYKTGQLEKVEKEKRLVFLEKFKWNTKRFVVGAE